MFLIVYFVLLLLCSVFTLMSLLIARTKFSDFSDDGNKR